jgi:hypothetical protein
MQQQQSYLAKVVRDEFGRLGLVNAVTGKDILCNLPENAKIETVFYFDGPIKKSSSFTVDSHGKIATTSAVLMFKPGAKITVEWEE